MCLQLPFKNVQRGRCTNVLWQFIPGCWSSIRESSFSEFSPKSRQTVICGILRWSDRRPDRVAVTATVLTRSVMYFGAWPQLILYISIHCLYNTRDRMGRQCNCWRELLTWSRGLSWQISRAAAFWTSWSIFSVEVGRPARSELQ